MKRTWIGLLAPQREAEANELLGTLLAFVAGSANAGGFLLVGRYTSHLSGIVAGAAKDLAGLALPAAAAGASLVLAFLAGSACTAILVNLARRRRWASVYALPLVLEALLLCLLGLMGSRLADLHELTIPLAAPLLCFIMGLQNALITKASDAIIRTTHVTGIVTDLGIELGKLMYRNDLAMEDLPPVRADRHKMRVLAMLLGGFFLGGLAGAWGFARFGFGFVLPFALLLLALALPHLGPEKA